METRETKIGLMFNIKTPYNEKNPKDTLWIRAADIIGIHRWTSDNYTSRAVCYGIRVAFTVGRGINGTDSTISVTKETYDAVAEYIGLPISE